MLRLSHWSFIKLPLLVAVLFQLRGLALQERRAALPFTAGGSSAVGKPRSCRQLERGSWARSLALGQTGCRWGWQHFSNRKR